MTTITRILRWSGEWHTVLLDCGHSLRFRQADLTREQLFVGKHIQCKECERKNHE